MPANKPAEQEADSRTKTLDAIAALQEQMSALLAQAEAERADEAARIEAAKPPTERRVDSLEKRLDFIALQVVKLGGHHYSQYE